MYNPVLNAGDRLLFYRKNCLQHSPTYKRASTNMKIYGRILIMVLIAFTASSCISAKSENSLLIFAAASMTDVLNEIMDEYENQNAGVEIIFNYGGSQSLAAQLNQGAPGDMFISAGSDPVDFLIRSENVELTPKYEIASNRLVIVTQLQNDLLIRLDGLQNMRRIAIADPDLAPAGSYAREALQNVGLWDSLSKNIVLAPDARATLNYVKTGNVDAGIVYYTDALSVPDLKKTELIPTDSYRNISYPVVIPVEGVNSTRAMHLAEFLHGEFSRMTLEKYGFVVPKLQPNSTFEVDRKDD